MNSIAFSEFPKPSVV